MTELTRPCLDLKTQGGWGGGKRGASQHGSFCRVLHRTAPLRQNPTLVYSNRQNTAPSVDLASPPVPVTSNARRPGKL